MNAVSPHPYEAGFTLVEALVSLTIAAAAFAVVGSALSSVSRGWSTHMARDRDDDAMRRAATVFRRDVRAMRLQDADAPNGWHGSARSMRFVATASLREAPFGAIAVAYTIERHATGDALVRRSRVMGAATPAHTDVVLTTSGRLGFSYFSQSTGPAWIAAWPAASTVPDMVRLAATDGRGALFETTVPVRPMASPACARAMAPPCVLHPAAPRVDGALQAMAVR